MQYLYGHRFRRSALLAHRYRLHLFFNPFFRTERKSVQASLTLKVVEFDHFEIRVVHDLPRSEEFQRGSGAEPVFNDIGGTSCIGTGSCHIGQADVVPRYGPLGGTSSRQSPRRRRGTCPAGWRCPCQSAGRMRRSPDRIFFILLSLRNFVVFLSIPVRSGFVERYFQMCAALDHPQQLCLG